LPGNNHCKVDGVGSDWWGTLPAWTSAVVAFFALGAASTSAWFNYKNNVNQQAQINRLESDKRKEQASKIAAWVVVENTSKSAATSEGKNRALIRIANSSDIPVFGLWVWIHGPQFDEQIGVGHLERVLPPGITDVTLSLPAPLSKFVWTSIIFDDAQGVSWYRDGFGNLTEQTAESVSEILEGVHFDT
jgi:hypothetical protein